ncbi:MAG: peptidase dimerization domain-containing protein [Chloroflexi bacterium]|nr:peptidase dimerization domain-containing protein [Chloroflexota bacterium]
MPPSRPPANASIEDLKRAVTEEIDRHADEIVRTSQRILAEPETGFRETRTARVVAATFTRLGIPYREGIAITGVIGRVGGARKGVNVAVMGELDSLIVAAHPHADPETRAAHACGHHCQIGSMLGVAYGITLSGVVDHLAGGVTFMAVPAEEFIELEWRTQLRDAGRIEFLGGKPEFVRLGEFDDIQIAMLTHTSSDYTGFSIGNTSNGMVGKVVRFQGVAAHAGGRPHLGVNALNAAHVALAGIHAQRETYRDQDFVRVHPIITKGGTVVNAVPDDVRMETYVRAASVPAIVAANSQVDRALRAGAMAVGGSVKISTLPGYLPLRQHAVLSELFAANARRLVAEDKVVRGGHGGGSTDMGDISHLVATIQPYVGGATGVGHSEHYLINDYALAVLQAGKAMAMTVVDLLADGGAEATRVLAGYRPAMTKAEYLSLLRGMQSEKTYSE